MKVILTDEELDIIAWSFINSRGYPMISIPTSSEIQMDDLDKVSNIFLGATNINYDLTNEQKWVILFAIKRCLENMDEVSFEAVFFKRDGGTYKKYEVEKIYLELMIKFGHEPVPVVSFKDRVDKILAGVDCKFTPLWMLVETWHKIVNSIEDRYIFGIYEYDNDVSVRKNIEVVLKSPELQEFSEFIDFKKEIYAIDLRLKNLFLKDKFRDDKSNWWEKGILANTTDEYREDIKRIYGNEV